MKKIIIALLSLAVLSTSSFAREHRVKVTDWSKNYERSVEKIPHTEYGYRDVKVYYPCGNVNRNSIGLDTIIGTGIGIALGHQVGGGNGKKIAKVVGGLGGAYTANQMRYGSGECYRIENKRVSLGTTYEYKKRRIFKGYTNCGYFRGERICVDSRNKKRYIIVHSNGNYYYDNNRKHKYYKNHRDHRGNKDNYYRNWWFSMIKN